MTLMESVSTRSQSVERWSQKGGDTSLDIHELEATKIGIFLENMNKLMKQVYRQEKASTNTVKTTFCKGRWRKNCEQINKLARP